MSTEFDDELALARALADICDGITLPLFESRSFSIEHKHDRSEVTDADREAERCVVDHLTQHRPDHAVFGEEHGTSGALDAEWRWIIDPIDGTSGFARGIPIWASLIALEHRDRGLCVSMISAPALARRWWATMGGGAWADGRRCCVSVTSTVAEAQVNVTLNDGWAELGATKALVQLVLDAKRTRGVGDFWQHCLVAEGAVDIAVDAVGLQPYDIAAVRLLVEEAGGRLTDRHGVASHAGPTAISSNGLLHDEVLRRLGTQVPFPR